MRVDLVEVALRRGRRDRANVAGLHSDKSGHLAPDGMSRSVNAYWMDG